MPYMLFKVKEVISPDTSNEKVEECKIALKSREKVKEEKLQYDVYVDDSGSDSEESWDSTKNNTGEKDVVDSKPSESNKSIEPGNLDFKSFEQRKLSRSLRNF